MDGGFDYADFFLQDDSRFVYRETQIFGRRRETRTRLSSETTALMLSEKGEFEMYNKQIIIITFYEMNYYAVHREGHTNRQSGSENFY